MRIVQLNPFYHPYAGGTERRIHELGTRLVRAGHEVHVITAQLPDTPLEDDHDGIHIHRLPSRFALGRFWNPPLVSSKGIPAAIARIEPDVVDFHYRWSPSYTRAYKSLPDSVARVFTYNNSYGEGSGILRPASLLNDRSARKWVARSDRIIAVSNFIAKQLGAHGFPVDKVRVIPNGIDAPTLRADAAPGTLPAALDGKRYLATCGRLVDIKRYHLAIRAMARLPNDVHLAIIGDGPERSALRREAKRAGALDRVHILGWVPEADKLRILSGAILFLHPAQFEAFGLAPLEAMAMGVPVIASDVGGLPEVVGAGGRTIRSLNDTTLAQSVRELLEDEPARRAARQAALRQADAFSWDAAATALTTLYQRVSEGKTT